MTDKFIYNDVTISNMAELMCELKEEQEISQICKDHSLNMALLKNFFVLASKGFNNAELAQKLGVHRVTVQRYCHELRNMEQSKHEKLFYFALRREK